MFQLAHTRKQTCNSEIFAYLYETISSMFEYALTSQITITKLHNLKVR